MVKHLLFVAGIALLAAGPAFAESPPERGVVQVSAVDGKSRVAVTAAEASQVLQASLVEWQLRRLNQPSERERAHERKGNVYIYDGLTDREVDRALNAHFDRIEYMMFVGTRKTESTDAPSETTASHAGTESPGCM